MTTLPKGWIEKTPPGWWPRRRFWARFEDFEGLVQHVELQTSEHWDGTDAQIYQSMKRVKGDIHNAGGRWLFDAYVAPVWPDEYPFAWIQADCPAETANVGHVG